MDADNVISVNITADASVLNSAMARMTADVKSALAVLEAAFKESNATLRIMPKSDPGLTAQFKEYQEELKHQLFITKTNLESLSAEWEQALSRIKAVQAKINAIPQQRDAGTGQMMARVVPPEIQQELSAELATKRAIGERMQRLQQFATTSATAPGQAHEAVQEPKPAARETILPAPASATRLSDETAAPRTGPATLSEEQQAAGQEVVAARARLAEAEQKAALASKEADEVRAAAAEAAAQREIAAIESVRTARLAERPVSKTPLDTEGTASNLEPWQVRKQDLIPSGEQRPTRQSPVADTSEGYSEAEMHERTIRNRNAETVPPTFTQHPIGSYGTDASGELTQLRRHKLDDPNLIFPEGRPVPGNQTVEKYADWIRQGSAPPPGSALETEQGNTRVLEGHHRAEAIRQTGGTEFDAWTSLTQNVPIGEREGEVITSPRGVTHEDAVRQALAAGKPVPPEVLADYPHLATEPAARPELPTQPRIAAETPNAEARPRGEAPAPKLEAIPPTPPIAPPIAETQPAPLRDPAVAKTATTGRSLPRETAPEPEPPVAKTVQPIGPANLAAAETNPEASVTRRATEAPSSVPSVPTEVGTVRPAANLAAAESAETSEIEAATARKAEADTAVVAATEALAAAERKAIPPGQQPISEEHVDREVAPPIPAAQPTGPAPAANLVAAESAETAEIDAATAEKSSADTAVVAATEALAETDRKAASVRVTAPPSSSPAAATEAETAEIQAATARKAEADTAVVVATEALAAAERKAASAGVTVSNTGQTSAVADQAAETEAVEAGQAADQAAILQTGVVQKVTSEKSVAVVQESEAQESAAVGEANAKAAADEAALTAKREAQWAKNRAEIEEEKAARQSLGAAAKAVSATQVASTGAAVNAESALMAKIAQSTAAYKAAKSETAQAAKRMGDIEAATGAQAAAGNQQAIKTMAQYRSELSAATEAELKLKLETEELKAALVAMGEAGAMAGRSVARAGGSVQETMVKGRLVVDAMTGATGRMETQFMRLILRSAALGPIMEAAFPVLIAGAMLEMLVNMVKKAYELYQNFVNLKDSMEALVAFSDKIQKATDAAIDKTHELAVENLKNQGHLVEAAKLAEQFREQKPLELKVLLDKKSREGLKELPSEFQGAFGKAFENVAGGANKLADLKTKYDLVAKAADDAAKAQAAFFTQHAGLQVAPNKEGQPSAQYMGRQGADGLPAPGGRKLNADGIPIPDALPTANDMNRPGAAGGLTFSPVASEGPLDVRRGNQLIEEAAYWEKFRGLLGREQEEEDGLRKEGASAADKAGAEEAEKAKAALAKREEAIRAADEHGLALQERDHELTTAELIAFWEGKLAKEKGYQKLEFDIQNTLGHLHQTQFKADASQRGKSEDQTAEAMTRPDDSPDYAAREKYWATLIAIDKEGMAKKLRTQEELNHAIEEANKNGAARIKQTDEDAVKAAEESFRKLGAAGKLSISEIGAFWTAMAEASRNGSPLHLLALKNIEEAQEKFLEQEKRLADGVVKAAEEQKKALLDLQKTALTGLSGLGAGNPLAKPVNPFSQNTGPKGVTDAGSTLDAGGQTPGLFSKASAMTLGAAASPELQELQQLRTILDQEYQLQLAEVQKEEALHAGEKEKLAQLQKDEAALTNNYNKQTVASTIAEIKVLEQHWQQFFNTFNQGFTQAMNKAITTGKGFGQSMQQLYNQMVLQLIDYIAQTVLKDVEGYLLRQLAATAFGTAIATIQATLAGATIAAKTAETAATKPLDVADAVSSVAVAAANAMAFSAILGPEAAIAAGATVEAAGAPFEAQAAFERGGVVPNAPTHAVLHPNEMVLPAPISQGFQNMLGAGGKGAGGNTHLHYSPTVHSYGAGGMEEMLKSHASTIHTIVKRAQRTGHLS
jgi:hypothetical protein